MAIPDSMKAVQVVEYNQPYVLSTVAVPKDLEPHDLLVKVAVASFCHTDLMVLEGKFGGTKKPITGSHEGSGTVVAIGSAVAASREFKVGDRVMCGTPRNTCGACGECTGPESNRQYCSALEGHCGVLSVDGFFAEYARVDARWTTLLPGNVSLLAAAPLACAGRTAWRGLQQAIQHASLKPRSWVCVVGAGGGLGHMAVQFAVQSGMRVIGIDARPEGLAATREAGAELVLDARDGKDANVAAVQEVTGALAGGVDATLLVADVTSAAALACAVTRKHGTVVELAQPDTFTIPFAELIMRDIKLVGSCFCSPQESRDMVASIQKHGIELHTVPFQGLEKIHDLVELVRSGTIKGKAAIVVDDAQVQRDVTLAGTSKL
ncbi:hypothetical protein SPBR_05104 [Sporothrix brasiliensis 5110]|uniref:Enoyl reductase (ER) domain-containing protein n=1 Tax=Sporothrix brasiliensis 5110 TaxID=1398154 RepID=A0A0C2F8A1_9PEZI|nr:uncharacterized protein SPBR_05104 [Sporothrix brasiliensis 5110]KIH87258.1 hypothetical protein SPBR_05104 [Sporothrix brasiliensis 5110]